MSRRRAQRTPRVRRGRNQRQGMTLIEIIIVVVIMALASAGISMSLGAISRANLKGGAGRLGGAMRYAYNRAVSQGMTVRVHFKLASNTFSIEEASGGVLLASRKDRENKLAQGDNGKIVDAIDPWVAAETRIKHPDKPSVGTSPFGPLTNQSGEPIKRYSNIPLGRGVQFTKLIVAHEPEPRTTGEGSVHFFPGGLSEHAFIELGDGRNGVYTVEVSALTGRVKIFAEAHETSESLHTEDDDAWSSEVKDQ